MNIKEIGLKLLAKDYFWLCQEDKTFLIEFAEALIAEIAKQNEPVALIDGNDEAVYFQCDVMYHYWIGRNCTPLFTLPPTAEQIANETAEACAAYLTSGRYMVLNPGVLISAEQHTQYIKNHDIYQANAIRRGAWKEFKKS